MRLVFVALVCVFVAPLVVAQQPGLAPDQIFYNGKIATVDSGNTIREAFAIKGDQFVAVGNNAQVRGLAGPQTQLIDLRGRTVTPGFVDNHIHPYRYVFQILKGVDATGVKSLAEMSDRIRQAAAANPGRSIYVTGEWKETDLAEKRGPRREELDALVPGRSLVVFQARNTAYLNSAALRAANITRDTKTLRGEPTPWTPTSDQGIERNGRGEPTGVIRGGFPILLLAPRVVPLDDIEKLSLQTHKELNALGFTSIREPDVPLEVMRLYSRMARDGKLTLRISMGQDLGPGEADDIDAILGPVGAIPGFGDHWLRLDSLGEFAIDAVTPYIPADAFRRAVMAMNRYGWRPAPHVNDPKALDLVLEGYEAANQERPIRGERWVIEHASQIRKDQLDRFAKLGVVVAAQFQPYNRNWRGPDTGVPMRDMLDHGLIVSAGSDWPGAVNNPFIPFYFYVSRKNEEGKVLGADQKISRAEALRVSTLNNAYMTFEENVKGSIEPGKLADFVILGEDILTVPEDRIPSMPVLATYVGGRKVFAKEGGGF